MKIKLRCKLLGHIPSMIDGYWALLKHAPNSEVHLLVSCKRCRYPMGMYPDFKDYFNKLMKKINVI